MATYAIGDLHGDLDALERLLNKIDFRRERDQLWFVGDIVNRGPDSIGCLRFIRNLGDSAITILGNHDLALLVHAGQPDNPARNNPSMASLFTASDGGTLLDWLRRRPLIHHDGCLGWTMVHAAIPAEWSMNEALAHAAELQDALSGPDYRSLLATLFGNQPSRWNEALVGHERLRYITNALTRQRFVHPDGALDMHHKAALESAPGALRPWFCVKNRRSANHRIVFGHWAALVPKFWPEHNVWCIDTGAAWGRRLSALRLDTDPEMASVSA